MAVLLLAAVVDALQIKEGDDIEIASDRHLPVARDLRREQAFGKIPRAGASAPPRFRFSRDDANERQVIANGMRRA